MVATKMTQLGIDVRDLRHSTSGDFHYRVDLFLKYTFQLTIVLDNDIDRVYLSTSQIAHQQIPTQSGNLRDIILAWGP